jgi:hypothetical protein
MDDGWLKRRISEVKVTERWPIKGRATEVEVRG